MSVWVYVFVSVTALVSVDTDVSAAVDASTDDMSVEAVSTTGPSIMLTPISPCADVTTSADSWAYAVALAVSVCVVLTAAGAAAAGGAPPAGLLDAAGPAAARATPHAQAGRRRAGAREPRTHVG